MNARHAERQVDVEVSSVMVIEHTTGHVDAHVSPCMRPEACRTTHRRSGGSFLLAGNFYIYLATLGYARDLERHTIRVHNRDIGKLLERASRDEPSYICLPEHASSFTQTKLAPEIYTKDEINEMFYGVCGAQGKYEGDFQMKLDGVYHPLNDSIG
ncbi:hypothetical protein YC2023_074904 [Brassica napus]